MNKYFITILFLCSIMISYAQNYDIRFNRTSVNCQTRQACYDVQLRPNGAASFNLAGQNYRIYWDASKASFTSGSSTLPSQYSPYTEVQVVQNVNAGATNGPLAFEETLGFLNYTMVLNDDLNGGIELPQGQWTTTSNLCFTVTEDVINNPSSCVEMVWGRSTLTGAYSTAFVEVSRWVSPNNTTSATGILYDDMNSGDGDQACFNVTCASATYDIKFNRTSVNCQTRQACYDVQLRPSGSGAFNLAGQNYRIYWDASKASFDFGTSLLPSQYSPYTLVQVVQNVNAGATNGPLAFEETLGFLNYTMVLNDDENGGIVLPQNQWTTTSNLCFTVTEDVINNPASCVQMVWGRDTMTGAYSTAFVEVSRWISANNTGSASASSYDDMNSGDGDPACFDVVCAVSSISINDVTVNESSGNATVAVCIPVAASQDVTVTLNTNNGTAVAGQDYTSAVSQIVTIPAGQTCTSVNIPIINDNISEGQEQFNVILSNPSTNASIGDGEAQVTIIDNEGIPTLSINNTSVNENAGTATLTITMSNPSSTIVTVSINSSNGSALSGSDYTAVNAFTVTIPAGSITGTITIPLIDDLVAESNETFSVTMTTPVNATISTPSGIVTILDNEVACNAQAPILSGN